MRTLFYKSTVSILIAFSLVVGCSTDSPSSDTGAAAVTEAVGRSPNRVPANPGIERAPADEGVETISVPSVVTEPGFIPHPGIADSVKASADLDIRVMDNIVPKTSNDNIENQPPAANAAPEIIVNDSDNFMLDAQKDEPQAAPAINSSFDSLDFTDNAAQNGSYNIPPDSDSAIGPHHVVNVVNSMIRFHEKDGSSIYTNSLQAFFSNESPDTGTFDPKVIFDHFEGRFVVVTLEIEDDGEGGNPEVSEIFVAVSDDADPHGTWCTTTIVGNTEIDGLDRWADYPGFAVDEDAVYIAANMFGFEASGEGTSVGVRLWIIDKGVNSSGFYDCGTAIVTKYDPVTASGGFNTILQPAQIHGKTPDGVGTFLVGYSGLSNGTQEFAQIIRVDNPLGVPSFIQDFVNLGDIEDFVSFDFAPQKDVAHLIDTGDRRALDAEWYDDSLWVTASISPKAGDTDEGEIAAHWWEFNTSDLLTPTLTQQGNIYGDDLVADLWTFYPSVTIGGGGQVGFGFSGSATTIYPSSYYTVRYAGDPAGTTQGTTLLKAGVAPYLRAFGGNNRWGDYSSTDTDTLNGSFWFYNEHSMSTGDEVLPDFPGETGRWATTNGNVFPAGMLPIDQWLEDMSLTNSWVSAFATRTGPNVIVTSGNFAEIIAGNQVTLGPGFKVENNATFSVTTGSP